MDDGSRLPEIAAQAPTELTPWIIAVALLFCAMFFAVTETAFASASRPKIKVAASAVRPARREHCMLWTILTWRSALC